MELEQKFATQEQSERIFQSGIKIKTLFCWRFIPNIGWEIELVKDQKICALCLPAPIAEEIAELLPGYLDIDGAYIYELFVQKGRDHWAVCYTSLSNKNLKYITGPTLTQAIASMLIWLIENNHIKPKELR